jgi:hypothetical protein
MLEMEDVEDEKRETISRISNQNQKAKETVEVPTTANRKRSHEYKCDMDPRLPVGDISSSCKKNLVGPGGKDEIRW